MHLKYNKIYFSSAALFFCMLGSLIAHPTDIKKPLSARKIDIGVMLMWSTSSEKGADVFVLEKSPDGKEFKVLSEVKPTGNSSEGSEYTFIDLFPENEVVYYRLKMIFTDGRATAYQAVQAIKIPITHFVVSKMNDSVPSDNWSVQLEMLQSGALKIELASVDGLIVEKSMKRVAEGYNDLNFSLAEFPDGIYTLTLEMHEDKKTLTIQKIGATTMQVNKNSN